MRPWRLLLLKHVNVKKKGCFFYEQKMSGDRRSRDDLQRHHKKTLLQKTEALEKHVKIVTMRAEAWATTEADFFKTLTERHEEAQKHLNELAAQLSQQNTATRSTQ